MFCRSLHKQVLAYQFPSAFSVSPWVDMDRKFKLRPFVLLLKLLKRPDLGGCLTDRKIAVCVIGYAESHSDCEAVEIAERIVRYPAYGAVSLDPDFAQKMQPSGTRAPKSVEELTNTYLKDIAYTAAQ